MTQATPTHDGRIVNVASVPHRSVFRYPGGKTWLIPWIRAWLASAEQPCKRIIEPFVGGGIVSLTAVAEDLVETAVMVELDPDVAAVWQVLTGGDGAQLAERVREFEPTLDTVVELVSAEPASTLDRAFRTLVKNRTFHGGILAKGSSPLKAGEKGRGVKSRWYPTSLSKRIMDIDAMRSRLEFIEGDGIALTESMGDSRDALFVDPPYTAAGKRAGRRLYNCFELDHERLFDVCAGSECNLLMTYDNDEDVQTMASSRGLEHEPIPMRNTRNAEMLELLIGHSLAWSRTPA